MRYWICGLCSAVLVLAGCSDPNRIERRTTAFSDAGETVKVMSFNIRFGTAEDGENDWEHRKKLVFDVIARQGADVVGLQEALDFQIDQIRRAVTGYRVITTERDDAPYGGQQCAILYRSDRFKAVDSGTFWFSNMPWKHGSMHWGNRFPRSCTWVRLVERGTERAFYVFTLHLDHESQVSRFKSAELLAHRVAAREPRNPVVVMGDFNMGLDNPAMRYLRRLGYPDAPVELLEAWRLRYPDAEDVRTYHGFVGGIEGVKIDHILVEPASEVTEAEIDFSQDDGRYPSDHYPVTATLRLWNGE